MYKQQIVGTRERKEGRTGKVRGMRWGLKLNREGDKYETESENGNSSMWK